MEAAFNLVKPLIGSSHVLYNIGIVHLKMNMLSYPYGGSRLYDFFFRGIKIKCLKIVKISVLCAHIKISGVECCLGNISYMVPLGKMSSTEETKSFSFGMT